jgi:hypothetical protein
MARKREGVEEYEHTNQDCPGISIVNARSTRNSVVVATRVDGSATTMGPSIGIHCRSDYWVWRHPHDRWTHRAEARKLEKNRYATQLGFTKHTTDHTGGLCDGFSVGAFCVAVVVFVRGKRVTRE